MYERFSDKVRRVMQLANQEAQRFNHEYIGTEHILLGLIKDNANVGSDVLKHLGVDLRKVRLEVEKLVQSGPDMVTMGKLPQTPRAKKVIELAMLFARENADNYVGTEHLLVGLLREKEGIASQILEQLDVTEEKVVGLLSKKGVIVKATISDIVEAIADQDFELAVQLKKMRANILDAALWRISTALTNHNLRNEDPQATIDHIQAIIEETREERESASNAFRSR